MVHWLNPCFCSLNSSETQVEARCWLTRLPIRTYTDVENPHHLKILRKPWLLHSCLEQPQKNLWRHPPWKSACRQRRGSSRWFYTCIQTIPSRLGGFLVMFFHHYTSWKFPKTSTNWADSHSNLWSFESGGSWMCSGNHGDLIFCMISMVKNWRFGNWFHDCQTS